MCRFGMIDENQCQRCNEVETTAHLLHECPYVIKVWQEISKLTGIKSYSINEVLGLHPFHDKVTITIHAETIRRLMAIDRPIIDPKVLVKSVVSNLYILERGVTKFQILKYIAEMISLTFFKLIFLVSMVAHRI